MLYDVLQKKREIILEMAAVHGIQNVRVFGSAARLEDGFSSDLDLLLHLKREEVYLI